MRRIYGLFLMVRALAPLLLVAAFLLITWQTVQAVQAISAPYVVQVNNRLDSIQATIDETQETVAALEEDIGDVAAAVEDISESLTVDLGTLDIPTDVVPFQLLDFANSLASLLGATVEPALDFASESLNKTFDILGLGAVKEVFLGMTEIMNQLAQLTGVSAIVDDVSALVDLLRKLWGVLSEVLGQWGRWVVILVLIALAILVISYVDWLMRSLRRGWALFNGQPDPGMI